MLNLDLMIFENDLKMYNIIIKEVFSTEIKDFNFEEFKKNEEKLYNTILKSMDIACKLARGK